MLTFHQYRYKYGLFRLASEQCKIVSVGEFGNEEDLDALGLDLWEATEKAEQVIVSAGIRIARHEDISLAAICDGDIVGGLSFGSYEDPDRGTIFSFSVAVDSNWRSKGLARRLVEAAVEDIKSQGSFIDNAMISAWVINPHMVALLESLGFESEGREWSENEPFMLLHV